MLTAQTYRFTLFCFFSNHHFSRVFSNIFIFCIFVSVLFKLNQSIFFDIVLVFCFLEAITTVSNVF